MNKKILFLLYCLLFTSGALFSNANLNPDQTLEKLLNLFKSYNISSIPRTMSEADYNKLTKKLERKRRLNFDLSTAYEPDGAGAYKLKSNLNEKARKKIINVFHQLNYRILTEKQKAENEQIKAEIARIFHFPSLIKGALKDQWDNMSAQERDNVYNKFKTLIELFAYPQARYFYSNSDNNFEKAKVSGKRARINSTNYNKDKDINITITYVFEQTDEGWVMVDMEMNEHSLIEAYKNQINRVVSKKGVQGLISILNKKYDEITGK